MSWRRPNAKYKISFAKLKERCAAGWLNAFRVARLAERVLKRKLKFYGIDEKPVYFNESGSKNTNTLEIKGEDAVRLKTNHSASRERSSAMTMAVDDEV